MSDRLTSYLRDVHAIELQALEQLRFAPRVAAGGWGMILFARLNPDSPGKLAMHAYAFEALEAGAYELLARAARRAGDAPTEALARRILAEERAAAERIAGTWDAAVAVTA